MGVRAVRIVQDATQRQRLGMPTHKALNVALCLTALVHVLVLLPLYLSHMAGWAMPALLGLWGATLLVAAVQLVTS